ncbi:MAG: ASKHA domain-containing protein, partial [Candidatus Hodarchaeales archaeon]
MDVQKGISIPHIEIQNFERKIPFSPNGNNLLTIIQEKTEKTLINSLCGSNGKCGKCRVKILKGLTLSEDINPPTKTEKRLLKHLISQNIRLACQVIPTKDIAITIIDKSEKRDNLFKIQDTYQNFQLNFLFSPRFFIQSLKVPPPTLENAQDDFFRLSRVLENSSINLLSSPDPKILSRMAEILRENDGNISVIIDKQKNRLIDFFSEESALLGVVIDVGTTSVVATLINLETGTILGVDSIVNPQIEFGRDIMSRLTYALDSPLNRQQLQSSVLGGAAKLIATIVSSSDYSLNDVYEIVVVGNSAMHHLFLNISIDGLSRAPFVPVISKEISLLAKEIDRENKLNLKPQAVITMPPLIGGFIGSDAVVDILYTGFNRKKGIHLLIDFGTNSEIILLKDGNLFAASVAAGGAFEGQHISCGMRGVAGAIEKFQIVNESYTYQTIQAENPKGICGTGIIDILAQLLLHGQLDYRGRLFDKSGEAVKKLILIPVEKTFSSDPIYITRQDVEAIQKAKAATLAAIRALTIHLNTEIKNIESVQIAGVFGSNLDIENAKTIGLLPDLPNDRFLIQGNTAEKGGRAFLLSDEARKTAETIAQQVQRRELTAIPQFSSFFIDEL